jgi:HK97 family phage major capsid protein
LRVLYDLSGREQISKGASMSTPRTWRDFSDAELGPELAALRSQRSALLAKANKLFARATVEGRDLTAEETREADALLDEAAALAHKLGSASMGEAQKRAGIAHARLEQGTAIGGPEARSYQPGEYRALAANESFREHLVGTGEIEERRGRPLSIGRAIVGLVTGKWDGAAEERRALSGSNDTAGGYMLSPELSATWIDRARAASVMIRAGVKVVPMRTASLSMLRVTGDPVPAWRGEGDLIATSEPAFGAVHFSARSLAVAVPVSRELLSDTVNAAEVVESVLVSAMGLELDRAVLDGDGVRKPLGIRRTAGVGTLSVGGAANTLHFAQAVGLVLQQNETPTGIVVHPRTFSAAVDRAVDSTNQPLRLPPSLERLPWFQTTSVPTNLGGGTETAPIVGDFSQVVVGLRQNIEIAIAKEGTTADGRGFARNEAIIVAILRADSMLVREKAFCVLGGITN